MADDPSLFGGESSAGVKPKRRPRKVPEIRPGLRDNGDGTVRSKYGDAVNPLRAKDANGFTFHEAKFLDLFVEQMIMGSAMNIRDLAREAFGEAPPGFSLSTFLQRPHIVQAVAERTEALYAALGVAGMAGMMNAMRHSPSPYVQAEMAKNLASIVTNKGREAQAGDMRLEINIDVRDEIAEKSAWAGLEADPRLIEDMMRYEVEDGEDVSGQAGTSSPGEASRLADAEGGAGVPAREPCENADDQDAASRDGPLR